MSDLTTPHSRTLDDPEERAALRSILAQADTVLIIDADLPPGITSSESLMPALLFLDLLDRYTALLTQRDALVSMLGADAADRARDRRWRYGVAHSLTLLRAALGSPERPPGQVVDTDEGYGHSREGRR